ncbi:MAG TPA: hypothetical protein VET27_25305 [Mycobacterium sp.]|nr:hypothetical protein [Mycobacterium sp.]
MEASPVFAAIAEMRAGYAKLAAASVDPLSHPELLAAQDQLERNTPEPGTSIHHHHQNHSHR